MGTIGRTISVQILAALLAATLVYGDRFTDNGNGTVTDSVSTLVWLKNAGCLTVNGANYDFTWQTARSWAESLSAGSCGLSAGSSTGPWRLPTMAELYSLKPSWPPGGSGMFTSLHGRYWSSVSGCSAGSANGLYVDSYGDFHTGCFDEGLAGNGLYVWPVSGGTILTMTATGTGGGTVAPDNGTYITWSGKTGTAAFAKGTKAILTASPDNNSTFGGWSGAGCSGLATCELTMDAAKSVTATFNPLELVRTDGSPHVTLTEAYGAAFNNSILQAKVHVFSEDLTLDKGTIFSLLGGFADDYGSQTGYTSLDGVLSIDTGGVTLDRLIIGYNDSSPF